MESVSYIAMLFLNSLVSSLGFALGDIATGLDFAVQTQLCSRDLCPGSQFTKVGAAWANIGYLAHADVLHMLSATEFGAWAPLLYVCAGIGALIGVAMNMPPKGYVWFFLGPSLYLFLIGTTQEVRGVDWVVANRQQPMEEVWRDAEVGLANLEITERDGITVTKDGPGRLYSVATPMLFLDSLFSNTANYLVEWSGLYRQKGSGASNSNLASASGQIEGPWYLLSNLKWGLLENIVSGSARDPNIRDALVTFLTSECGDAFKKGVDSGRYMAAAQARGLDLPPSVMRDEGDIVGPQIPYRILKQELDVTSVPTPRSLLRIFQENDDDGSFGAFAPLFRPLNSSWSSGAVGGDKRNKPLATGRGQVIVCSEYLYTLVQAFRHEAGHTYWQLVRSAPNGFTRDQFFRSLFYGWNIRKKEEGSRVANEEELRSFVKHLILLYIVRNELLFAPQVTQLNQRFSPSEQNRTNSESLVRTMGSKAKFAELYNWAILMPFLQGVLLYFVIMAYPFAAMMMILPGHHKTFFTWVSFFAWLKLWDVGFAFVQVLERSVWAMIGNQSAAAKIAGMVIDTAQRAGTIGVDCKEGVPGTGVLLPGVGGGSGVATKLSQLCAIPRVCSVAAGNLGADHCASSQDQSQDQAFLLWDRMLLLGASADLDLANGYYIYIMAALYMAVPAVTGQLVLGAKSGAASMAGGLFNSVASEAGGAARTGYQHDATNKALTNAGSLGQAAYGKAMRGSKLPSTVFGNENDNLNRKLSSAALDGQQQALGTGADMMAMRADSYGKAMGANEAIAKAGGKWFGLKNDASSSSSSGGGSGDDKGKKDKKDDLAGKLGATANALNLMGAHDLSQKGLEAKAFAAGSNLDTGWDKRGFDMAEGGANLEGQRANQQAGYEADMAVWEAKNAFASHAAANAGIAGMNTGNLAPSQKPTSMAMASGGDFNSYSGKGSSWFGTGSALQGADVQAQYGFGGRFKETAPGIMESYKSSHGSGFADSNWGGAFTLPRQGAYAAVGQFGGIAENAPSWAKPYIQNQQDPGRSTEFMAYKNGSGGAPGPEVKKPELDRLPK